MSDNCSDRSTDSESSDALINIKPLKVDSSTSSIYFQETLEEEENSSNLKKLIARLDKEDKYLSNFIHDLEVNIWIENFIYFFARFFNPDSIFLFYLLLFLYEYFYKNDSFFIIKPIIHVITTLGMSQLLKYIFKRPRPEINENVKRRYNLRQKETNHSMPSGDSAQAGNFAIIILTYFGSYYGFLIIPFVMFARIFFFCHYLLDTIIGALIGIGVSLILVYPLKLIQF